MLLLRSNASKQLSYMKQEKKTMVKPKGTIDAAAKLVAGQCFTFHCLMFLFLIYLIKPT